MANGQILRQITVDLDKIAEKAGVTVAQARRARRSRASPGSRARSRTSTVQSTS